LIPNGRVPGPGKELFVQRLIDELIYELLVLKKSGPKSEWHGDTIARRRRCMA
jgi:hypothetical protein